MELSFPSIQGSVNVHGLPGKLTAKMSVRLQKPWRALDRQELCNVSGQLGVFQLADDAQEIVYIGFAGGRSIFGLQGELEAKLGEASFFRLEVTTAYRTRHREPLMLHHAEFGAYPVKNTGDDVKGLGRLSVSGVVT